jgi:hypothetical protein
MAKKMEAKVIEVDGELVSEYRVPVKVTMKDIVNGQLGDTNQCAIALAVNRVCGDSVNVEVGGADIAVGEYERPKGEQAALDERLNNFVNKFDALTTEDEEGFDEDTEAGSSARRKAVQKAKLKPFEFELVLRKNLGVPAPRLCDNS